MDSATAPAQTPPGARQLPAPGRVVLVRHGQTRWAVSGRHTGRTDVPLTPDGEATARSLGPALARLPVVATYASPLQRARRTAELAELTPVVDEDLVEWDYGGWEGLTTAEIGRRLGRPWSLWIDGVPPGATPGETIEQVAQRATRVLDRVTPQLADGDVVLVAHGHLLRVLAAVWLGTHPRLGAALALGPGGLCLLGHEHRTRVLLRWNQPPPGQP